jgi:DNA-binding NtrC family response regulator
MDAQPGVPIRTVVVARPKLARQLEELLRGDGHEVYRTPDAAGVVSLVERVRAHLVIIALDLPWADSAEAPHRLAERVHQVPVLLIGEAGDDERVGDIPRLSSPIDGASLRTTVSRLLGLANAEPDRCGNAGAGDR